MFKLPTLKRLIDCSFAALGLIILSPLFILIAHQVRRKLGSPVLFRQQRAGLHGAPFEIIKFRTMKESFSADGSVLPDTARVTEFGGWLRSTSLDEIPELWNVLCGEMSLVGPRPLLVEYLPLYTPLQARRHEVSPGITGWAQINGRNCLSWEEKFELDVWYVDNRSFWFDLKILFITGVQVFRRHGINAPQGSTVPRFTGSK